MKSEKESSLFVCCWWKRLIRHKTGNWFMNSHHSTRWCLAISNRFILINRYAYYGLPMRLIYTKMKIMMNYGNFYFAGFKFSFQPSGNFWGKLFLSLDAFCHYEEFSLILTLSFLSVSFVHLISIIQSLLVNMQKRNMRNLFLFLRPI